MNLTLTIPVTAGELRPGVWIAHKNAPHRVDEVGLRADNYVGLYLRRQGADPKSRRLVETVPADTILDQLLTEEQAVQVCAYLAHCLGDDWRLVAGGMVYDTRDPLPEDCVVLHQAEWLTDHLVTRRDRTSQAEQWRASAVLLESIAYTAGAALGEVKNQAWRYDPSDEQVDVVNWVTRLAAERDAAQREVERLHNVVRDATNKFVEDYERWQAERDQLNQQLGAIAAELGERDADLSRAVSGSARLDAARETGNVPEMPEPDGGRTPLLVAGLPHTFKARMIPSPTPEEPDKVIASRVCECGLAAHAPVHQAYQVPTEFDPVTQDRPQIVDGEPDAELRSAVFLLDNGVCPESNVIAAECPIVHDHLVPNNDPLDPDDEVDQVLAELSEEAVESVTPHGQDAGL